MIIAGNGKCISAGAEENQQVDHRFCVKQQPKSKESVFDRCQYLDLYSVVYQ